MASVSNEQGRRAIQFVGTDEKRHSIRLGKCDQRTAEGVKLHVERLAGAKKTGMPIHVDTVNWLASISDELHGRIARSGLTSSRQTATGGVLTLGKMVDAYIDRRKADMKPWSITTLNKPGTSWWTSLGRTSRWLRLRWPMPWTSSGIFPPSIPAPMSPKSC
jgi:hypothetical protein